MKRFRAKETLCATRPELPTEWRALNLPFWQQTPSYSSRKKAPGETMNWHEWGRTKEGLALWVKTFADAKKMLTGAQGQRAKSRPYREDRALWVEIREPLDGVRLISLEFPTEINPPRVYLKVWTYRPQGDQLYQALIAHKYKWQGVPVTRYENDRPRASWQKQLTDADVEVSGLRHVQYLSQLAEIPSDESLQALHDMLESFCVYVATVASGGQSQDASLEPLRDDPLKTPPETTPSSEQPVNAAAAQRDTTTREFESLVPVVQDLLLIDQDPRFSQEPPPTKVALANARIGQGGYRERMLEVWDRRCALTGCPVEAVLIASHARPWSLCETTQQCLDEYNGLLLSANLDRLFDQGLIAFADNGTVMTRGESAIDAMVTAERIRFLDPRHVRYLAWHRNHFGFS